MSLEAAVSGEAKANGSNKNKIRKGRTSNNNKEGGPGRGKGRGKGGSRSGKGKGASIELSKGEKIGPQNENTGVNSTHGDSWFLEALGNLGHYDPSSIRNALNVQDDLKTADAQLMSLTLWLEDRLIRCWNLEQREALRKDFWNHIHNYLNALECPEEYFPTKFYNNSHDKDREMPHWRHNAWHRTRVLSWLISCATSEAYGDIADSQQQQSATATAPISSCSTKELPSDAAPSELVNNPFPLGFSTGDDQVDHFLKHLRMRLLIQLEEDQKIVNEAVSQVQSVTSAKAKPLKQAKLRHHHNAGSPPPPPHQKKSNKQHTRGGRRR